MAPSGGPRVSAIVLAAGLSSRFGGNKLTALLGGKTFVERVADGIPKSDIAEVLVVVGNKPKAVARALRGRDVSIVNNPRFRSGMASSIRAGIRSLRPDAAAVMLLLGDQPLITRPLLGRLLTRYRSKGGIVATKQGDVVGPPVIFPRELFNELQEMKGDQGAREVISKHKDLLSVVRPRAGEEVADIDTREELRAARLRIVLRTPGGAPRGHSRHS